MTVMVNELLTEVIPGYRLLERLGQGGFGEVWKAEAPGGFLKAVKIVHGNIDGALGDPGCAAQELKALQRVKTVRHPFLLSLERCDIINGRLVIVMELADRNLFDRFQECRAKGLPGIPREELLDYMDETAEALDLMNREHQLQHLDVKPQNLFLLYNHIKVGDFGLVKDLEGMRAQSTSGVTAVYASPETFECTVSRFSDQYSLAMVYQELLTGQLPFNGKNPRQLMMQHLTAAPDLTPLPPEDRGPIARALAKRPEDRFPSCGDLVHALRQAGESPPSYLRETPGAQAVALGATVPEVSPADQEAIKQFVSPPPPQKPEETGDGPLLPALVIGLGGLAAGVLQEFRRALHKRWGPPDALPHLRLLQIDADPDALEEARRGEAEGGLGERETVLARLLRPAHYLKTGRERQAVETWFPMGALSRLPRDQVTPAGWRPLGRLAFAVNAGTILGRLRAELEACTNREALATAERHTGLAPRSNWPRVYVVAGLAGGTGSGMIFDVAYGVRQILTRLGYPGAEVVGLFLAPDARGRDQTSPKALANTFAALTELSHYASPQGRFTASYPDNSEVVKGQGPPFSRCFVLALPRPGSGAEPPKEVASRAGDFLCRALTSPLGRAADQARARLLPPGGGVSVQTFGAYWFAVPRRPLLQRVARCLCHRLVLSWQGQDSGDLEKGVQEFLAAQLERLQLTSPRVAGRLEQACTEIRGQDLGAALEAVLCQRAPGGSADLRANPAILTSIIEDYQKLLAGQDSPPSLAKALEKGARKLEAQLGNQLAELAMAVLVEPQFRLTGAEELVKGRVNDFLMTEAKKQQDQGKKLTEEARALLKKINLMQEELKGFAWWGKKAKAEELLGLLPLCARKRFQGLLAGQVAALYQALAGNLSRYFLDVSCCHPRIGEFLMGLKGAAKAQAEVDLGLGQYLLPAGCRTLTEAADRVLGALTPEELREINQKVQKLIGARFQAQLHLCTAGGNVFKDLEEKVFQEVAACAEDQLTRAHAAKLYLEQHAENATAIAELANAFEEAAPDLPGGNRPGQDEVCILGVPQSMEGEYFRALVAQALPDQEFMSVAIPDDIVFYRELPALSLSDLPQLSRAAQEAYSRVLAEDKFTPHNRLDVPAWRPTASTPAPV